MHEPTHDKGNILDQVLILQISLLANLLLRTIFWSPLTSFDVMYTQSDRYKTTKNSTTPEQIF